MTTVTLFPVQWHQLGRLDHVPPGEGKLFKAGEMLMAVFRSRSGELYATQPLCPHRGGPLADGIVGGKILVCPLHGFKFDLATGQPLGNDCPALKTFPVRVDDHGYIQVALHHSGGECHGT